MRVVKPSTVRGYWGKHPRAEAGLSLWLKVARAADWSSIRDVRQTFAHADPVVVSSGNTVTIFNVGGNHFRLVVAIKYHSRTIYVREFLTHAEYDSQRWKARH